MVLTFEALKGMGKPKEIHLVSVIGAKEGIKYIEDHFESNTHLWIADIDPQLNSSGYIIPGLGDAGDLSFGDKLQH
jgi:uracil phosphoribosyltransferase